MVIAQVLLQSSENTALNYHWYISVGYAAVVIYGTVGLDSYYFINDSLFIFLNCNSAYDQININLTLHLFV